MVFDDKLIKWLSYISDRNISDKGLWEQLVIFLERDLKVHQQKLLLQNKFDEIQQDRKDDDHKRYQVRSASHYSGQDHEGVCSFCDDVTMLLLMAQRDLNLCSISRVRSLQK